MTGLRTLADYPEAMIFDSAGHVPRVDRRDGYGRPSLIAFYSEKAALPDVLRQLAHDCLKRNAIGNDTCRAYV